MPSAASPSRTTRAATRAAALPPEERRSTIVEALIPLLIEYGDSVTTKQIAEATGVAEGTIFRVFPDKEAVIQAAIAATIENDLAQNEIAAIDPDLPFPERLIAATGILQERLTQVWSVLSAVGPRYRDAAASRRPDNPALVQLMETADDELRLDPTAAAGHLRALTVSLTHPSMIDEPASPEQIVDLFLHGVAKR